MKVYACRLMCTCGGYAEQLDEGILYSLTEKHTIIFRGICNSCGDGVQVERDIMSLTLVCPTKEGEKGN